jgi:hypothetical protein
METTTKGNLYWVPVMQRTFILNLPQENDFNKWLNDNGFFKELPLGGGFVDLHLETLKRAIKECKMSFSSLHELQNIVDHLANTGQASATLELQ